MNSNKKVRNDFNCNHFRIFNAVLSSKHNSTTLGLYGETTNVLLRSMAE